MEVSVFQKEKLWKYLLALSVILTEVKSLVSTLPVNVAQIIAIHDPFGQENPKLNADNTPTST